MLKLVVLISGEGTNLQAIIDSIKTNTLHAKVVAVISNKTSAGGLARAQKEFIPAYVIPKKNKESRKAYDERLASVFNNIEHDLIVLAGFMRIFSENLANQFKGKMINIHPSLLPKYRGLHTHQKALDAGDKEHGCSIHFVTPELDGGPLIAQAQTLIEAEDNPLTLSAKVQTLEHKMYPLVLQWFAENRILMKDEKVFLDGTLLVKPHQMQ